MRVAPALRRCGGPSAVWAAARCPSAPTCRTLSSAAPPAIGTAGNWVGNVPYHGGRPESPASVGEIQDIVRNASVVRVVGSGHSFVPCMTAGRMISMTDLPRVFEVDRAANTVMIDGGMTYAELARLLDDGQANPLTLANTPSLPHITVTGAIATGTHGSSGVCAQTGRAQLGSQSVQVAAFETISPDGKLVWWERGQGEFDGAVISFGCLGPVTRLKLALVPEYDVLQSIYGSMGPPERHDINLLFENWWHLLKTHDSVSIFPDWARDDVGMVITRTFGDPGVPMKPKPDWAGIPLVTEVREFLDTGHEFKTTIQAPSLRNLFWFLDSEDGATFGPQPPDELQLEYFVPLEDSLAALRIVHEVASRWGDAVPADPQGRPLSLYCELRVVRADNLWLSPTTSATGGDTLALAFGMNKYGGTSVLTAAKEMESALAPLQPRPHWAKLHAMDPLHVTTLYGDTWDRFVQMQATYDPEGKFLNDWAQAYLDPAASSAIERPIFPLVPGS